MHVFVEVYVIGDQSRSTVRELHFLRVFRLEPLVVIDVQANAFLLRMVRNLAGALKAVGRGQKPVDWVGEILAAGDRRRLGKTAPAAGLYLVDVRYPERYSLPGGRPGPFFLFPQTSLTGAGHCGAST